MPINYPLYIIKQIRVEVRDPKGGTTVRFHFDEIVWSGKVDYVRPRMLTDGHVTLKKGWRCCFTKVGPYTTHRGGIIKVDMKECGLYGKFNTYIHKKVEGEGKFVYQYGDKVRLTFVVEKKKYPKK